MPTKKTSRPLDALVLAAGEDRFESSSPKELHPLLGRPLLSYPLQLAQDLGCRRSAVAVADRSRAQGLEPHLGQAKLAKAAKPTLLQLVRAGLDAVGPSRGEILLLPADQPLVEVAAVAALAAAKHKRRARLALLSVVGRAPSSTTCLERDAGGEVCGLRQADAAELGPHEIEIGVWICDRALLERGLEKAKRSRGSDRLLRCLIDEARARKGTVAVLSVPVEEALSVVSRVDMTGATMLMRQRINRTHLRSGVGIEDPATTFIEPGVDLAPDVSIGANVQLRGATRIERGATIEANTVIIDSEIGASARIRSFSHLEGARVREAAIVGPYARLRPLADIGPSAHIGNFVEVKKAVVEAGAKANHLAYLGDARIGAKANVGAGTICCNYDGVAKHHTDIGAGVFVGSNATLVAPVDIEDGAYVAAGSTVTQAVPADALAFGRARQTNKPGMATRIRQRNLSRAGKR